MLNSKLLSDQNEEEIVVFTRLKKKNLNPENFCSRKPKMKMINFLRKPHEYFIHFITEKGFEGTVVKKEAFLKNDITIYNQFIKVYKKLLQYS